MTSAPPSPRPLFGQASDSPAKRACAELDRRAPALAAALRRAFPFMVRRGVVVTSELAAASSLSELEAELGSPRHVIHLETHPGKLRGALLFDVTAIAFVFDGALGGDASALPELGPTELTAPQRALAARFASGVLPALSAVMAAGLGFALRALAAVEDEPSDDEQIVLRWRLGAGGSGGTVALALDRDALLGAPVEQGQSAIDPGVAAALGAAPLELVAELGRVRLTLRELSALRVGGTLSVPVNVGEAVAIRVEDRLLFEGHPTTSGARVAIRIAGGTHLDAAVVGPLKREATP